MLIAAKVRIGSINNGPFPWQNEATLVRDGGSWSWEMYSPYDCSGLKDGNRWTEYRSTDSLCPFAQIQVVIRRLYRAYQPDAEVEIIKADDQPCPGCGLTSCRLSEASRP